MPGGRREYEPTEKDARMVEALAVCGSPQEAIARVLGIDAKTLRKHFRDVLDTSADKADAQVAASLFKMATLGKCPAAAIFWMKARRGWRETNRLEHTGPGGAALPIDAARALLRKVANSRPPEDPDEAPVTR